MKIPVDTARMAFLVTGEPSAVVDYDTKQPRATADGEPLYAVPVCAMCEGTADLWSVKVPGRPEVVQGQAVRVVELAASPWTIDGRSGVSFRASRVEAVAAVEQ